MTAVIVAGGQPLRGRIRVPGDKSISHRALLFSALASGESTIRGLSNGDDVHRTRLAIEAFGADVRSAPGGIVVRGGGLHPPSQVIDVGNSGTAIRLLAGFVTRFASPTVLDGDASVRSRPMDRIVTPLRQMGAKIDGEFAPMTVTGGQLSGIEYTLPVASAQVKSAILIAGLAADGETTVIEPVPTRAHTEEMLGDFGADISVDGQRVTVRRCQLRAYDVDVPGDPSQAAFWAVAAAIVPGSDVTIENVYLGRARAGFVDVLARMGADVRVEGRDLRVVHRSLTGTDVDAGEVAGLVDEVPVLAVAATAAEGLSRFHGVGELRVKESDRLATTTSELGVLGAEVTSIDDTLTVRGGPLDSGVVQSHGDHRIAMMAAVAGLACTGAVRIDGWECVETSYPGFIDDLRALGGRAQDGEQADATWQKTGESG